MHGGAPSALFAHVLERYDPGPAMFVVRLTIDLLRPVPLVPLTAAARTARPGKKVQWLDVSLFAGETEVARASALRMRETDVDVASSVPLEPAPMPPPESAPSFMLAREGEGPRDNGMWNTHELRAVSGSWMEPGPASVWFRLLCPVVDEEPPSALERVAACADFGSGVGSALRFTKATAINAEVTIHVHRRAEGEWVGLESGGYAHGNGVGQTETRLFDRHGPIGRAAQSMLVEPITVRRPPGVDRDR
jgi:hypothetical protein